MTEQECNELVRTVNAWLAFVGDDSPGLKVATVVINGGAVTYAIEAPYRVGGRLLSADQISVLQNLFPPEIQTTLFDTIASLGGQASEVAGARFRYRVEHENPGVKRAMELAEDKILRTRGVLPTRLP